VRYCDAFAFRGGRKFREKFSWVTIVQLTDPASISLRCWSTPGSPGVQTYLSTGVSLLAAIMAAHRTAASQLTAEPAALQGKIDQISAALIEG
jgi:hypothetical protein